MISGSDPLNPNPNDPWWISGWTAQNHLTVSAAPVTPPASFPSDIPLITIFAIYMAEDATPAVGSVLIRPNATYRDTASGDTVLPRVKRYPLVNGRLDLQLPASDSAALEAHFSYTVREAFPGGAQFAITVPSAATGPQELHRLIDPAATIVPIESVPPMYGWQYPAVQ